MLGEKEKKVGSCVQVQTKYLFVFYHNNETTKDPISQQRL